jgi:hypothetical protein
MDDFHNDHAIGPQGWNVYELYLSGMTNELITIQLTSPGLPER